MINELDKAFFDQLREGGQIKRDMEHADMKNEIKRLEAVERRNATKLKACIGTLEELRTICDNTPVNLCRTEVIFGNVRKQNDAMNRVNELVKQLLDTCKARDFTDSICP